MQLIGVLLFAFVAVTAQSADPPQCTQSTYKILSRDTERSANNTVAPTGNAPCDNMADGWYRFGHGEIATSCVPTNHCGTTSTIWMKDPVPKIGETIDNDFCVNHGSSPQGVCCLFSFKVKVTNCGGFLVYFFRKDDVLCPSGYCSTSMTPCKNGGTSATGFEPCVYTSPSMDGPPTLHPPVPTSNLKDFSQTCQVNYTGNDPDAAFEVTWLFDGNVYKQMTLKQGARSAALRSIDWKGHVGQELTCRVASYFESNGTRSMPLSSVGYYGGVQVIPDSPVISEGSVGTYVIQSTLPILCPIAAPDHCDLLFDVNINSGSAGGLYMEKGCSVRLYGDDWDSVTGTAHRTFHLSPTVDPVVNPDQHHLVSVSLDPHSHAYSNFKEQQDIAFNVTTKDVEHHRCLVVGQSDVMGFDMNTTAIAGRQVGTLLLYKGTGATGKTLQIQTEHWTPEGYFAVVCGIAFQYGDTLIKVEMCNNDHDLAVPVMTQGARTPEDVQVYICDSNYEIVTSDGVRLSIVPQYLHLDVKLHLPPSFSPRQQGACAHVHTLSTNRWSDVELQTFSVDDADSLFGSAGVPFYQVQSSVATQTPVSCRCSGTQPECSHFNTLSDPGALFLNQPGMKRCSAYVPHALNPDYGPFSSPVRPLSRPSTTVTKDQITHLCDTAIMTQVNRFCLTTYQDHLSNFQKLCQYDYRGSSSPAYVYSSLQAFQWWCEEQTYKDSSLFVKDSHGNEVPSVPLTTDSCPGFCSIQGTCHHGTCSCKPGTVGPDCSVFSNSSQPVIVGIKGGAGCQMSNQYCNSPILVAENIYPSDKLEASVTLIELKNGYLSGTNTSYTLEPIYDNHRSVTLHMTNVVKSITDQTAYGFLIQLSVDGTTYSSPYKYIVWDDKCQQCNVDNSVCYPKPNTCRINHKCFYSGELNPGDNTQVCDPNRAILKWSNNAVQATGAPQIVG